MNSNISEVAKLWSVSQLEGLRLLRASYIKHSFKRHAHEYFVIGMVESGLQKFLYQRQLYVTPPAGLIVINPGEAHTGEAAIPSGFHYRALYPEVESLAQVASEIKNTAHGVPFFSQPVILDTQLYEEFHAFHVACEVMPLTALDYQVRYLSMLVKLITRHGDINERDIKRERYEIKRICLYIEENYAEDIQLNDLARLVYWSPYYLLRVFGKEIGLPPHKFLESVRIRKAQMLLNKKVPISEVAYATGFNSQSHFTTTFRRMIGVTPAQYAKEVNF
jgi:AraC-like DNA-binding protein